MNKLTILVFSALLFILGACSSNQVMELERPPSNKQIISEYKIGVGDALQVSVWRNPDLSMAVPVRPDGKISLPLVGDVQAAGVSTEKLSGNIANSLGSYIKNPQVTVIVTSSGSAEFRNRVRVTGAVNSQITTPYRDGMTVLDLVLEAGGLNEFASGNNAKLYRGSGGAVKVYPIFLDDILKKGRLDSNYELSPSDIITVPERVF